MHTTYKTQLNTFTAPKLTFGKTNTNDSVKVNSSPQALKNPPTSTNPPINLLQSTDHFQKHSSHDILFGGDGKDIAKNVLNAAKEYSKKGGTAAWNNYKKNVDSEVERAKRMVKYTKDGEQMMEGVIGFMKGEVASKRKQVGDLPRGTQERIDAQKELKKLEKDYADALAVYSKLGGAKGAANRLLGSIQILTGNGVEQVGLTRAGDYIKSAGNSRANDAAGDLVDGIMAAYKAEAAKARAAFTNDNQTIDKIIKKFKERNK